MNPIAVLIVKDDAIDLGEALMATVEIEAAAPFLIRPPSPLLTDASRAYWIATPIGKPTLSKLLDGEERWSQQYRLEPKQPGDAAIGFNSFTITIGNGEPIAVQVPVKAVKITTVLTAESKLKPIAGPDATVSPRNDSLLLPIAFVLLAFAGLLIATLRSRRRRPMVMPVDPMAERLKALAAATNDRMFASEVSQWIRVSLAGRASDGVASLGINTPAIAHSANTLTTDELALTHPGPHVELLRQCDRVLFAGEPLSAEDRRAMLEAAKALAEVAKAAREPKPTR
jgi:hypothetical protein